MSLKRLCIILANVIIFWILLPCGLYLSGKLVDRLDLLPHFPAWIRWPGVGLAILGGWICLHSVLLLRFQGKGLPISALPPTCYVTSGPYRIWRHPIYTGFTLLAAGLSLVLRSPGLALVVVPALATVWHLTWVRLYEEPGLLRRFGPAFRTHRRRTTLLLPFKIRRVIRALFLFFFRWGVRLRVEGQDNVPRTGPLLMLSDHLNYLDFIFAQYACRRPIVIPVTAEVFRNPLQRLFMWIMGGVPKRRFCADPAAAMVLEDELAAGGVVGIAVEGERSWTGELGPLAPGVARALSLFNCPMVPVALVGSYGQWPRWAGGSDRSKEVIVKVGKPFHLEEEIEGFRPGDPQHDDDIKKIIKEHILTLRNKDEISVDFMAYPSVRPQLVLWRCPLCGAEEELSLKDRHWLICGACSARWDARGGDLTLVEPASRAGERDTLAGWARAAEGVTDLPGSQADDAPLIQSSGVELREDPHASVTLEPLHSQGEGQAALYPDRILWQGPAKQSRTILLSQIRTVTTERNDTLQLGKGRGVVQLVFASASPLRWQRYLLSMNTRREP